MDWFAPKYRRDPNEKVHSLYQGVAHGGTVRTLVKASLDRNRLEASRDYGAMMPRGQGGRIATLVIGGMETTLDEMEYLLEEQKEEKFVPRRSQSEIAGMCRRLADYSNEYVKYLRKNPSERPRPKKATVRLHLPVGYRFVATSEPGFKVLARI